MAKKVKNVNRPHPPAAAPIGKLLLKPVEVATAISSSKAAVYRMIASGELPAVHLPSRSDTATRQDVRVRLVDLEAWIANKLRRAS